jgi:hypothetical protein
MKKRKPKFDRIRAIADATALFLFTSGSTQKPVATLGLLDNNRQFIGGWSVGPVADVIEKAIQKAVSDELRAEVVRLRGFTTP